MRLFLYFSLFALFRKPGRPAADLAPFSALHRTAKDSPHPGEHAASKGQTADAAAPKRRIRPAQSAAASRTFVQPGQLRLDRNSRSCLRRFRSIASAVSSDRPLAAGRTAADLAPFSALHRTAKDSPHPGEHAASKGQTADAAAPKRRIRPAQSAAASRTFVQPGQLRLDDRFATRRPQTPSATPHNRNPRPATAPPAGINPRPAKVLPEPPPARNRSTQPKTVRPIPA